MKMTMRMFAGVLVAGCVLVFGSGCENYTTAKDGSTWYHANLDGSYISGHMVDSHKGYVFPDKGAPQVFPKQYGLHEKTVYSTDHAGHESHKHLTYHCKLANGQNEGHVCNTFGHDVTFR